jgi:hypothetical protein
VRVVFRYLLHSRMRVSDSPSDLNSDVPRFCMSEQSFSTRRGERPVIHGSRFSLNRDLSA